MSNVWVENDINAGLNFRVEDGEVHTVGLAFGYDEHGKRNQVVLTSKCDGATYGVFPTREGFAAYLNERGAAHA